jgi:hypothetical protein
MVDWHDPLYQKILARLPAGSMAGDFLTSLEVTARKPSAPAATDGDPSCCEGKSNCCR